MKRLQIILTLLFCAYTLNIYAQHNSAYNAIQQAKSVGEKFETISALTLVSKTTSQSKKIQEKFINPQEVCVMQYSKSAMESLKPYLTLNVPLSNKGLQLELQEVSIDYVVKTSDNQTLLPNKNIKHYRGVVKDNPHSTVAITFGEEEIIGLIATEEGNFNMALDYQLGEHLLYNDKNVKELPAYTCEADAKDYINVHNSAILSQNLNASAASLDKFVRLYFETTFDIFQTRGSIASVETFITGLYNQVSLLYRNENITTKLSEIFIWTTLDPYATTTLTTAEYLRHFTSLRTSFDGDLGQLVTFRSIGGGRAYVNTLCYSNKSYRLSVAGLNNTYQNVPNYSWSAMVVTHELGHLLGSLHTHDCVWNGNNTAIDGCAPTSGGCTSPPIPANGGTMMSYCHLQSVGINFNLGFGEQPGNVIRNSVANASCLLPIPTISGPSTVCPNSTATFTVSNAPAGYTWGCSSNLTPVAGSPGSFRTSNAAPNGSVSAQVSINYNGVELARKNVTVRRNITISGPYSLLANQTGVYQASSPCTPQLRWYLQKPGTTAQTYVGEGTSKALVVSKATGIRPRIAQGSPLYTVWGKLYDGNSILSESFVTTAVPPGYELIAPLIILQSEGAAPMHVASEEDFVIQPNPASTTLHVKVSEAIAQPQAHSASYRAQLMSTITGAVVLDQMVSGESFDLDVSGVLNGNYTLVLSQDGSKVWSSHVIVLH